MILEEDIRTALLGFSAVTALVVARIRPHKLHQNENKPALVVAVEEMQYQNDLDSNRAGAVNAVVVVSCIAETNAGAWALADAVRFNGTDPGTGLAGYDGTPNATQLHVTLDRAVPRLVFLDDGNDSDLYVVDQYYQVWFEEQT